MVIIPLQPVVSQTVNVVLADQSCTIDVYAKGILAAYQPPWVPAPTPPTYPAPDLLASALYLDLYVSNVLVLGGIQCLNGVAIVRDSYLGFVGDLAFYDTQGATDPVYTGLGGRYVLAYLSPGDIAGTTVQTLAA